MNTTVKNIFVNPEAEYLRAGWRAIIFVAIAMGCNTLISAPLIALLQSQFPGMDKQTTAAYIFYSVTTLATWLMLRFVDKRPFVSVGVTFKGNWIKELSQGMLFGFGMMSLIFVVEYSSGLVVIEFRDVTLHEGAMVMFSSAALFVAVGYGEEFLFRGYLFQTFVEGSNKLIATLTLSVVFAVAHAKNPNVSMFGLINIGLAGIWLSMAYFKTKALWLPIGLHISWNFTQGFIYSYPVSGTTSTSTQIGKAIVSGPDWLTGGTFGPEGGVLGTLALIVGTFVIYQWKWVAPSGNAWTFEGWREERKQAILLRTTEPTPAGQ